MKRLLSIFLALTMITAMIPAVFASGTEEPDGITIEYKTAAASATNAVALNEYEYTNTGGRLEYYGTSGDPIQSTVGYTNLGTSGTDTRAVGYFNLKQKDLWWAYKIKIPKSGKYDVMLEYGVSDSAGATGSMYILPGTTEDITSAIAEASPIFKDVVFFGTEKCVKIDTTGEFTAKTAGEYYMVWQRTGESGNAMRPARLTLSQGTTDLPTLIYADVELSETNLDAANSETADITLGSVYMSNGNEVTDEDVSTITYKSSDEAVAIIENNQVKSVGEGTATIYAMNGDYSLGDAEITVVDSNLSRVKVEYSFVRNDYDYNGNVSAPSGLKYQNSAGGIQYYTTTSGNENPTSWSWVASTTHYALFNTSQLGQYHILKIRIPQAGDYKITLENASSVATDIYILSIGADIKAAIESEDDQPLLSVADFESTTDNMTAETIADENFNVPVAGEYFLVFAAGTKKGAFRPAKLTLDGNGTETSLIYADISLDETTLEVDGTATLTQGTAYLSDGNTATDLTGVTYKSTNTAVATLSDGTITAVAPGTTKIQAVRADGYVLDEETVTVTRPTAPTVSFYAESNNASCPIKITATDVDNNAVVEATAATLIRGADVTVNAPVYDGYTFRGWMRGTADGQVVSLENEYSFKAMTHTMLTAVYTADEEKTEFYNFNGEFLGTTKPTENPTLLGYTFSGTWREEVIDGITRCIAQFEKTTDTYDVSLEDGITEKAKDEAANYYDTEVVLEADSEVFWLRGGKVIGFGKTYTFNIWGATNITTAASGYDKTLPMVYLDSAKGTSRMIEYDKGAYDIVEVGILFGEEGDALTVDSSMEKATSQWKRDHGQFTAKPTKDTYTNARGYLIYEDDDDYKVIYAD